MVKPQESSSHLKFDIFFVHLYSIVMLYVSTYKNFEDVFLTLVFLLPGLTTTWVRCCGPQIETCK